jgi:PadR family transcriptional regulator PadR
MAALRMTAATRRVLQVFLDPSTGRLYGSRIGHLAGLSSGRTYPILARLEGLGWLSSVWEYVDPRSNVRPARRYYGLTWWGETQAREILPGSDARAAASGDSRFGWWTGYGDGKPPVSCSWLVESAVRRLPSDATDRYRREFLTELHYLADRERILYAFSIRFRVAAMTRAMVSVGEFEPVRATDNRPGPPLHCRVHLWHRWAREYQPGVTFEACRDCGRLAGRTIFDPVIP